MDPPSPDGTQSCFRKPLLQNRSAICPPEGSRSKRATLHRTPDEANVSDPTLAPDDFDSPPSPGRAARWHDSQPLRERAIPSMISFRAKLRSTRPLTFTHCPFFSSL